MDSDWLMNEDELAELLAEQQQRVDTLGEAEADHAVPDVADEQRAEKHLRAMRYWQMQIVRINAHAAAELERLESWVNRERGILERKMAWHERGLVCFLKASGAKTIKLIGGTLKRIAGRESLEVQDEMAFLSWADATDADDLIRLKVEPDKKAIREYIKRTGEIPPGTDLKIGEDSFKVVLVGDDDKEK